MGWHLDHNNIKLTHSVQCAHRENSVHIYIVFGAEQIKKARTNTADGGRETQYLRGNIREGERLRLLLEWKLRLNGSERLEAKTRMQVGRRGLEVTSRWGRFSGGRSLRPVWFSWCGGAWWWATGPTARWCRIPSPGESIGKLTDAICTRVWRVNNAICTQWGIAIVGTPGSFFF